MTLPSTTVSTPGLTIAFRDTSDWGTGFIGGVTITNTSGAPISNWTIAFNLANTITNLWNAQIASHTGSRYVLAAMPYNGSIATGQSVSFGFQATGGAPTLPTSCVFNGQAVGSGTTPPPTLSIADASVTEATGQSKTESFTVSLSAASTTPVSVAYTTVDGTAHAGTNYTATSGTLTFVPGTTSQTISVPTNASGTGTDAYTVRLSNSTGASIAGGTAIGTIINPLPTLSIEDATVTEGSSPTPGETFTLHLSTASASTVTVAYKTVDGTAKAGADYTAASGTATFQPGSKTATITIATQPGTAGTKTFALALSNPSGATLADGTATGTIIDPTSAGTPSVSVADVTVDETTTATGGTLLPSGYLSTAGNQIIAADGTPVKISAINWYGFETNSYAPQGLWAQSYKTMMDQMVHLGFNAIRLPFSLQLFGSGSTPTGINYSLNPDLAGLNGLGIMDKIVSYANQIGLKIILDDHRSAAGSSANDNGLWYDGGYTEADWITTWKMLATHYAGNSTVIAADLLNEPHGAATWGDGSATDWAAAATRAGDAIQAINPHWLIMVEGIQTYQGQSTWWGGNLMGAASHPVTLTDAHQLVYSAHDYPSSVYAQPWFSDPAYPANLDAIWNKYWGYLYQNDTAPVFLGEFGSKLATASDQEWVTQLVKYLDAPGGAAGAQGVSWAYWDWNPTSGDTGGILKDDWSTIDVTKMNAIMPALYHSGSTTTVSPATVDFQVKLSTASSAPVSLHYQTTDGTAKAGVDYVAQSGTLIFAPGTTTAIVSADLLGDASATASLNFFLSLSDPVGASLLDEKATATLIPASIGTSGASGGTSGSSSGGTGDGTTTARDVVVTPTVSQSWTGGFLDNVTVTNNGDQTLSQWEVEMTTPSAVTNLWNAVTLSHSGNTYLLGNAAYNGTIAAHGSVSFGFQAAGSSADPLTAVFVHS